MTKDYVSGRMEVSEKERLKLLCKMRGISVSRYVSTSVAERMADEIGDGGKEKFDLMSENFLAERKPEDLPGPSNITIIDLGTIKKTGKKEMFGTPKEIQELVDD